MSIKLKHFGFATAIVLGLVAALSLLNQNNTSPDKTTESIPMVAADTGVISAVYQQDVDHFSDDARAMSPRSWGGDFDSADTEPKAPAVTFGPTPSRPRTEIEQSPDSNRFLQAEHGTVREPKKFFETQPLETGGLDNKPDSKASPIPDSKKLIQPPPSINSKSPSLGPDNRSQRQPIPEIGDIENRSEGYDSLLNNKVNGPENDGRGSANRNQGLPQIDSGFDAMSGIPVFSSQWVEPKYNPALGHRSPIPNTGPFVADDGEEFPFEKDKEFPPMREILAQAVMFSEFEFMFLQPSFQGNTALTVSAPAATQSQPFNFDLEPALRIQAGFESEYGPGFAGEYFQFDNNSEINRFTSDGTSTGETRTYQGGPDRVTLLLAQNPGETINAIHSLEVHSSSVYAFKSIEFKRAYVNGRFGLQLATIEQKLEADLLDGGGGLAGRLRGVTNMNAFGPRFGIDYVRKMGHTPMQLISSSTVSLLFGDRDQTVENTVQNEFTSLGADGFVTVIDIFFGIQMLKHRGEKRNTAMRLGYVNQSWLGGGTAIDPNGDFGFQGLSMMLGFNR